MNHFVSFINSSRWTIKRSKMQRNKATLKETNEGFKKIAKQKNDF